MAPVSAGIEVSFWTEGHTDGRTGGRMVAAEGQTDMEVEIVIFCFHPRQNQIEFHYLNQIHCFLKLRGVKK